MLKINNKMTSSLKSVIILGIDPGTLVTGYGVIEINKGNIKLLSSGIIRNRAGIKMPLRLKEIYLTLCDIINRYHPDELAIESAFYGKNAQSAMKIGLARGVAILAGVNREIPATEYTPREIKKAIVGSGAASKQQVQFMVRSLLNNQLIPALYDVSDALAVALCHCRRTIKELKSEPSAKSRIEYYKNWTSYIEAHPERIVRKK
jgi:crossover junction endodeoxyribonuclease RuvC